VTAATVSYPGRDGRTLTVRLRPGVVDGEARRFYGDAACALLAEALHELTGWPLLAVCAATGRGDGWHEAIHAAVISPDGRTAIDIHGTAPAREVISRWDSEHGPAIPVTVATAAGFRSSARRPAPDARLVAVTRIRATVLARRPSPGRRPGWREATR
jgi:hypothetical protein